MIRRREAAELHRRYRRFEYPIDAEDVAAKASRARPRTWGGFEIFPTRCADRTLRDRVVKTCSESCRRIVSNAVPRKK